jgi:hypothetical protein
MRVIHGIAVIGSIDKPLRMPQERFLEGAATQVSRSVERHRRLRD